MNDKNTLRNSLPIELLLSLKKGKKIEIKKSHQGRFTEYCGGNVTNECISRGKNSPDPKIRKQAVFAENARKWKHAYGGLILKYLQPANGLSLLSTLLWQAPQVVLNLMNKKLPNGLTALMVTNDINANAKLTTAQAQEIMDDPNSSLEAIENALKLLDMQSALFGSGENKGAIQKGIEGIASGLSTIFGGNKKEEPQFKSEADKRAEYLAQIKKNALTRGFQEAALKEYDPNTYQLYYG